MTRGSGFTNLFCNNLLIGLMVLLSSAHGMEATDQQQLFNSELDLYSALSKKAELHEISFNHRSHLESSTNLSSLNSIGCSTSSFADELKTGSTGFSFEPVPSNPFGINQFGAAASGSQSKISLLQKTSCAEALKFKTRRLQQLNSDLVSKSNSAASNLDESKQEVFGFAEEASSSFFSSSNSIFHSALELQSYEGVFQSSLKSICAKFDVKQVFYGLAGSTLVGSKMETVNQKKLCEVAKKAVAIAATSSSLSSQQSLVSSKLTLENAANQKTTKKTASKHQSLYYATTSAALLNKCELAISQSAVESLHKSAESSEDLYYAVSVQQNMGIESNSSEILEAALNQIANNPSALSIGYALRSASLVKSVNEKFQSKFVAALKALLAKAIDVGDSMLQFEGGVTQTSLVVSAIYNFVEKLDTKLVSSYLTEDYAKKFSNYLLSRKSTVSRFDLETSFQLLAAVNKLSSNKLHVPTIVSLSDEICPIEKKLKVRVTDPIGRPLPANTKVYVDSLTNQKWRRLNVEKVELHASKNDSAIYELDVKQFSRSHGVHNFQFSVESNQNSSSLTSSSSQVAVNIKKQLECVNAEINTTSSGQSQSSASSSTSSSVQSVKNFKLEFGKKLKNTIQQGTKKDLALSFQLKDQMYSKITKTDQTFIVIENSVTKKEYYYAVKADKINTYNLQLDLQKALEHFGGEGCECLMKMVVAGDTASENSFSWHMADIKLDSINQSNSLSSQSAAATSAGGNQQSKAPEFGGVAVRKTAVESPFSTAYREATALALSVAERKAYKTALTRNLAKSADLRSAFYASGALMAVDDQKIEQPQLVKGLTSVLERHSQESNVESIYQASEIAANLNIKQQKIDKKLVSNTLKTSLTSSGSTKTLLQAIIAQKNLELNLIDSQMSKTVMEKILENLKSDSSASSLGYAFHATALLPGRHSDKLKEYIEKALHHMTEVEGKFIHFENSVAITSLVVSGIYKLAEKCSCQPAITKDQYAKIVRYLLSQRTAVKDTRVAYHLHKALKVLSNNQFHSAVVASTAQSRSELSSRNSQLQLRVANCIGESFSDSDKLKIVAKNVVFSSTEGGAVHNSVSLPFKRVIADKSGTGFTADFLGQSRAPGNYRLMLDLQSADKRHVLVADEVEVVVAYETELEDLELQIFDKNCSCMKPLRLSYPEAHSSIVQVSDARRRIPINFQLKQKSTSKLSSVQKAFIVLQHSESKKEHIFSLSLDGINRCEGQLILQEATETFASEIKDFGKPQLCRLKLVFGDAVTQNPVSYTMFYPDRNGANVLYVDTSKISLGVDMQQQFCPETADLNIQFTKQQKKSSKQSSVTDLRRNIVYSYFTKSDAELLRSALKVSLQNQSDLAKACFASAGTQVMDGHVDKSESIQSLVKNQASKFTVNSHLEQLFYASSAASAQGIQITISADVIDMIKSTLIDDSTDAEQLYLAVATLRNLQQSFDAKLIQNTLVKQLLKETNAIRIGYAFQTLLLLDSNVDKFTRSLLISKMQLAVSLADDIDNTYLCYDSSITSTAFMITSIFAMAERLELDIQEFPLNEVTVRKFAKYLLSSKDVLETKLAYRLVRALKVLSNNKYYVPVCSSLVSRVQSPTSAKSGSDIVIFGTPKTGFGAGLVGSVAGLRSGLALNSITVTGMQSDIQYSIANMLGESISSNSNDISLSLNVATHISSGVIDTTAKDLKLVKSDLYELDFKDYVHENGLYKTQMSMTSSDRRFILLEDEFYVNSLVQLTVDDLQLSVNRAESNRESPNQTTSPGRLFFRRPLEGLFIRGTGFFAGRLAYPNSHSEEMDCKGAHSMSIRFQLKQVSTKSVVRVRQAFLLVQNRVMKSEVLYIFSSDSSNTYNYELSFTKLAKDNEAHRGPYSLHLLVGGSVVYNPFIWRLANLKLQLSSSQLTQPRSSCRRSGGDLRLCGAPMFLYLTQEDHETMTEVFVRQLKEPTDLESLCYSASGLSLLGYKEPLSKFTAVNKIIYEKRADVFAMSQVSSVFFLFGISTLIGDKNLTFSETEVQKTVDAVLNSKSVDPKDLYFTLSLAQGMKNLKLDFEKVKKHLKANSKPTASGLSLGFGFHTAAGLYSMTKELLLTDRLEQVLDRAAEGLNIDELQLEEGMNPMAIIVSGALSLAANMKTCDSITKDRIIGFSKYLLSYKGLLDPSIAYNLLLALNRISNNKHHVPISASLASASVDSSATSINSRQRHLDLRVVNVFGKPISESANYRIESSTFEGSSSIDEENIELNQHNNDSAIQRCQFFDVRREKAPYTLNLNMQSSDKRLFLLQKQVNVKVASSVTIDNLNLAVVDQSQQIIGKKLTLSYPNSSDELLKASLGQFIAIRFYLSEEQVSELVNVNQAYAILSSQTNEDMQMVYPTTANADNSYTFQLDLQRAKDMRLTSGAYNIKLAVGDASIDNPLIWQLGAVDLKL